MKVEDTAKAEASKTEEAAKAPEGAKVDDTVKAEEAAKAPEAAKVDDTVKSEQPAKVEDAPKTEEAAKVDDTAKTDANSNGAAQEEPKTETSPVSGGASSQSIQDYYRYRSEPIDGQYGENHDSATQKDATPPTSGSIGSPSSDDNSTSGDDDFDDETVGDGQGANGSVADAMLLVASRWVEDFVANYGLKISQVAGLLGQIR